MPLRMSAFLKYLSRSVNLAIFLSGFLIGIFSTVLWFCSAEPGNDTRHERLVAKLPRGEASQTRRDSKPKIEQLSLRGSVDAKINLPLKNEYDEVIFTLPDSIAVTFMPTPVAEDGFSLDTSLLRRFGLTEAEAKAASAMIGEKAHEISKIEANNSKLVTTPEGEEFYRIEPFHESGNQIKLSVDNIIKNAFSRFNDDRGEVFRRVLLNSRLFSDFGQHTREISFSTGIAPDGSEGFVFTTKLFDGEFEVSDISTPLDMNLMNTRYKPILEKGASPKTTRIHLK